MVLLKEALQFIFFTWWLWLFLVLFPITRSAWLFWRQSIFKSKINYVLLELRIPREIKRSARAMEQVFMSIYSLRNDPNLRERYMGGEFTRWLSLEMISAGGEVHFYMRVPDTQKDLVRAAVFSYYPDVEVVEVEDYMDLMPKNLTELYGQDRDLWGVELVLVREAAYPIKTYPAFESGSAESNFDPISTFLEVLGKLQKEEFAGIQFVIRPMGPKWNEKWMRVLQELKTKSFVKAEGAEMAMPVITPGQTEMIKAVENNLAKPAFESIIRLMYVGPKAAFYDSFVRSGISGAFNQYSALNMNSFKPNAKANTKVNPWKWPFAFAAQRAEYRKQRALYNFRRREYPPETNAGKALTSYTLNWNNINQSVELNVESLATLFHIPTSAVLTAPHLRRVESKKVGPPAGIAIFGSEEEIEKYK